MDEISVNSNLKCTCGMSSEEAESIEKPLRFVLVNCLSIGINLFGIIANSIATTILLKHDLKSIFNKTLLVLAIFDAAFNAVDILETIRSVYYDNGSCLPMPSYQKIHLYLTPQFLRPLRMFLIITSMYTTVVIALERYLAVSKPILAFVERDEKNWKKVFCMLGPVMFVSFLLAVPLCFEFFIDPKCTLCFNDRQVGELNMDKCDYSKIIQASTLNGTESCINRDMLNNSSDRSPTNGSCYICTILKMQWTDIRLDKTYSLVYRTILLNISTYVIPLIMLFVFNWLIYKHLKERRNITKYLGKITLSID